MKYPKVRGAILEKYGTQASFAEALGIHAATLNAKLCGRVDWTRQEVEKAGKLLGLTGEELYTYFFNL